MIMIIIIMIIIMIIIIIIVIIIIIIIIQTARLLHPTCATQLSPTRLTIWRRIVLVMQVLNNNSQILQYPTITSCK